MQDQVNLSNSKVADIYQNMLSGDKNALFKLQQINVMSQLPPVRHKTPIHHKSKINTEQHISQKEESNPSQHHHPNLHEQDFKEVSSAVNMTNRKEQMYMNAVKKGAKMGNIPRNEHVDRFFKPPKRVNQSLNQQYASQKKETNIKKDKLQQQFSIELKTNQTAQVSMVKNNKIYALPKVPKAREIAKVQSSYVSTKQQPSVSGHQKSVKENKKSNKQDFKQLIGKNKKQRNDFQKKNEEQLRLQMEIVNLHRSKKQFIDQIKQKFDLNFNNKNKYLKRKKKTEDIYHFKNKEPQAEVKELSPFKAQMEREHNNCMTLTQDINMLKMQFNNNVGTLVKLQNKTFTLSYAKFLQNKADSITDYSQEDEDVVEPLETSADIRGKYKHLMAQTKDRKWGLMQRTQYQAQRTQSLSQSRQTGTQSRFTHSTDQKILNTGSGDNKVVINERLKNLLFN